MTSAVDLLVEVHYKAEADDGGEEPIDHQVQ